MKPQPVPLRSFADMFQPGRKLLGLTELVVDVFGPEKDAWGPTWADDFQEMLLRGRDMNGLESTACIRARDVLRIAACCPNLKRLTLNGVLEVEYENAVSSSFRAMQGLQQLTHLCLGGPWLTNNTAAVVAGMTNLRSLQLHNAPVLMANGLERLTALQQLRSLQLKHIGPHREGNFCFEADTEVSTGSSWGSRAVLPAVCFKATNNTDSAVGVDNWEGLVPAVAFRDGMRHKSSRSA
jgi:hypothetical protein